MHNKIGILALLIFTLLLPACSSGATGASAASTSTTGTAAATEEASQVPLETQLLLGTIQLEGTDNAVNAEQAATLLPLWKLMRALSESDITAQVEVDAVVNAIQASMNAEQLQAIEEMTLSSRSMLSTTQDAAGTSSSQGSGAMGGGMPGGDMSGGGAPAGGGAAPDMSGGGGMPMGGNMASISSNTSGSTTTVYDTVIAYLETKVNS